MVCERQTPLAQQDLRILGMHLHLSQRFLGYRYPFFILQPFCLSLVVPLSPRDSIPTSRDENLATPTPKTRPGAPRLRGVYIRDVPFGKIIQHLDHSYAHTHCIYTHI